MESSRRVSIIVPYYNSAKYIGRLIESVRSQSFDRFQCILVDDGSDDDSFELIRMLVDGDPRFINVHRPENRLPGGRGAKNFGFSLCDGEYTVFFDSDDVMHPEYLASRITYLDSNPSKDAVVSDFGWRVTPGEHRRVFRYNRDLFEGFRDNAKEDWFWLHYLDYRFFFSPGNPMWRRSSIEDKPLWEETTTIGEDYEYHARLILSGLEMGIIDGVHYDLMANEASMIATSDSTKPLLGRSYGKMLVIDSILRNLGLREKILKKELYCQTKILRRIMTCEPDPVLRYEALDTMIERIDRLMNLLRYSKPRRMASTVGLKAIVEWQGLTGRSHRLYSLLVPDEYPTLEHSFFKIS